MKVIFLDVDGVLNSLRTVCAYGGWPYPEIEDGGVNDCHNLDWVAIKMVQKLADQTKAEIVLHSTWRDYIEKQAFIDLTGLFLYDYTEKGIDKADSIRKWLAIHPDVKSYVILDDDNMEDFNQVFVDPDTGLSLDNISKAREILGE